MSVSKAVLEKIQNIPEGEIITLDTFSEFQNKQAVALALSRFKKEGILEKLGKGKYFLPKKTRFGTLKPSEGSIIESIIGKDGAGYVSGTAAYNKMGLTTQIPNTITIVSHKYSRRATYGNLRVKFEKAKAPITKKNITLLQVLDAIRDLEKIPDARPENAIATLKIIIGKFTEREKEEIMRLSTYYRPCVIAVLGEILQEVGYQEAEELKEKINPLTKFKLGSFVKDMPYRKNWNIV